MHWSYYIIKKEKKNVVIVGNLEIWGMNHVPLSPVLALRLHDRLSDSLLTVQYSLQGGIAAH